MTLAEALRAATRRLAEGGIEGAGRDARRLLAHAARLAPDRLSLHLSEPLRAGAGERLEAALAARLARRPVAQIVGARAFWGREFAVTPDTLDPRPETETLVAAALEAPFARLLDLGTGTGCLAVTLLAERGTAAGTATDISPRALAVARVNAERHGVAGRLDLVEADWGAGLVGPFDLVVSNPPYIAAEEMADLAPEVRCHEPWAALTDGADGLTAYRRIAAAAPALLAPGGRLIVEIGPGQAASVEELFAAAGLAVTGTRADMDGRERAVTASTA